MQKNWYIIYTRPKWEKKVVAAFSKRKIENFLPVSCKHVNYLGKMRTHQKPLFNSYVFAHVSENDMSKIKLIDGVLNFVFWRGKPAIVPVNEIEAIKEFITDYQDIKLEKTTINLNGVVKLVDRPKYLIDGNLITLKNTSVKLNLPSLGYKMIAEIHSESMINKEVVFHNTDLQLQS